MYLCPEDLPVRGFSAKYVLLGTIHGEPMKGGRMDACLQIFLLNLSGLDNASPIILPIPLPLVV